MTTFYTFRFKKSEEDSSEMFAEFLGEDDENGDLSVTLFASDYPHFVSINLEETKETLSQILENNPELELEIVKVSQKFEVVT